MIVIGINNLTKWKIDKKLFGRIGRRIFKIVNVKNAEISLAFVPGPRMKELNKRYRGKDRTTDVLSFEEKNERGIFKNKNFFLGEVIISPDDVKKNSKKFKFEFKTEIARVFIHGVLHLLGHDHEKGKKEETAMNNLQDKILNFFK